MEANKLISDFKDNRWEAPNLYERLVNLCNQPDDAFAFCKQFLLRFEEGAPLFDDALSYITEEHFQELIVLALELLSKRGCENENAANVIAYASLQYPSLLHEHLALLLKIRLNEEAYYSAYPWRCLPLDKANDFKNKLFAKKTKRHEKEKLFECLLQTRLLEIIEPIYHYTKEHNFFEYIDDEYLDEHLIAVLENVGFTLKESKIVPYCSKTSRHINFQQHYFLDNKPLHLKSHPTWKLSAETDSYAFGGMLSDNESDSNNSNNNPFSHLITLSSLEDVGLSDISLESLTLGLHCNQLNEYEQVFYQHNDLGEPQLIGDLYNIEGDANSTIKPTKVSLAKTPKRWNHQDWGMSNHRQNLFRIGGEPAWVQGPEVPKCPKCNEKMNFLLQLDSLIPDTQNNEIYFASGGICYGFWCDNDKISGYTIQST